MNWPLWPWFALIAAIVVQIATAKEKQVDYGHLLWAWSFDPLIYGLLGLVGYFYAAGVARRGAPAWRVICFYAGLVLVFVSLQSPLDAMADRLFSAHQIQHMILRVNGPLLMLLATPQGTIFAGMPRLLRKWLVATLAQSGGARRLGGWLVRPVPATAIFILGLYLWEVPAIHNAALLDERLHYFMHVTMLMAGMIFFWAIFDPRDPPKAAGHGQRIFMLLVSILSEMALGAATTLKPMVLYTAYDVEGRLFGIKPLSDEATGGFLIWSPTSMMFLVAIMLVLYRWNGAEARAYARRGSAARSNSAALLHPETAEELWMVVRPKNRRLGLSLALVPPVLIIATFGMAAMVNAMH
ncbi:MAG: cytochrome c oxidase assembly protein [Cypionkella sp.]